MGNGLTSRRFGMSEGQDYFGAGVWSRSGRYFFYEGGRNPNDSLWVARETAEFPGFRPPRPERLTAGAPGFWSSPAASPVDETTIFAINHYTRPELVRLDAKSRLWQPVWDRTAAFELAYSKDCQWVAFTKFPDYSIWKARPDGSERVRLTSGGMESHQPHWSPDGSRIAYMGQNAQGQWHIFLVSSSGGRPEELTTGDDGGVPTWSPDGRSLIFGERLTRKSGADMAIHKIDLAAKTVSEMPGTRGLWSPRWSQDGHFILALSTDSKALRILEVPGTVWKELIRKSAIDNATWSADSRYIYFNAIEENRGRSLYRIAVPSGKSDFIVSLDDFDSPTENWFGVDVSGVPLAFHAARVDDIFKLKCELP